MVSPSRALTGGFISAILSFSLEYYSKSKYNNATRYHLTCAILNIKLLLVPDNLDKVSIQVQFQLPFHVEIGYSQFRVNLFEFICCHRQRLAKLQWFSPKTMSMHEWNTATLRTIIIDFLYCLSFCIKNLLLLQCSIENICT